MFPLLPQYTAIQAWACRLLKRGPRTTQADLLEMANAHHTASPTGVAVIGTVERAEGVHNHLVLRVVKRVVRVGGWRMMLAAWVKRHRWSCETPYSPTASP